MAEGCAHILTSSGPMPDGWHTCSNCGTTIIVEDGKWTVHTESPLSKELRELRAAADAEAEAGDEARREARSLREALHVAEAALKHIQPYAGLLVQYLPHATQRVAAARERANAALAPASRDQPLSGKEDDS